MALAVLVAGCTHTGAVDDGGTSPEPAESISSEPTSTGADDRAAGELPVPTVWVLATPPGFEDVMPEALTDQWADIVSGPECVLAGRAGAEPASVDDMRAASVQRLEQLAAENGASLDDATDIDLTAQGAGEGNDPHFVLTLVTADWHSGDDAVRGLSRVGNLVQYDGSLVNQWLDLTYTCAGEIDERAWTAVIDDLRPVMQVGQGWDGLTSDDL